jgi:tetratricopeptide (TPR) repeat protein
MKHALLLLVVASAIPARALSEPCSAAATSALAPILRLLDHGNNAAAESALAKADAGDCSKVLLIRARIATANDQTDQATDLFRSYIEQAPDDPEGYAYFARLMIDAGDYAHADQMSAIAVDKSSNNAAALAVRGQLLALKGDKQGGVTLLTRACELAPENAEVQFQLGAIYDRARLPAEALTHFKRATELDPDDARSWDYLALQLEPLGKIAEADAAYQTGLRVNRDGPHFDAFLDYNYGRFLINKGDLADSKAHLDRAVQLVPDMRATWYERARVEVLLRSLDAARKDAEKAASLPDPDGLVIDLQLYSLLEQIYRRLGETDLANKYAELARTTPPPVRGERH